MTFATRIYFISILLMSIQLIISGADCITAVIVNSNHNLTKDEALSTLLNVGIPLSATASVITLVGIYNLRLNDRLMGSVTEKDEPFSNTTLLSLLLAFTDF